jgi:hypothetical protein
MAPWLIKGRAKSAIDAWSYGTDHPEKWRKLTWKLIAGQMQFLQVFQIPEGLRDAPYRERGQKNSEIQMVSGDRPGRKWRNNL